MTSTKPLLAALALGIALPLAAPAGAQTLAKIRKQGSITLGYIDGAPPFSFVDEKGQPQGYSVELCRTVAQGLGTQLKRENLKIRWVKLTIQNRLEAVRRGRVDLECSTTTWTLGRQALVDFSLRGDELAHGLIDRLHNQGVRVVVISGYADVPLAPGKVAAILHKPIKEELLLAALRPTTKAAQ